MSQISPMLPLYVSQLGVQDLGGIERWSGIIFGCNFITLAIFSPIWGRLSDRFGRKPMCLRASLWLSIIMIGMGLAQNVYQLAGLRLAQGAMSGFQAATIPLVAQESPQDQSGWALGTFFTFQVSGQLLGPLIGGWLAELIGLRGTFFTMGAFCFLGFLSLFMLHETVQPKPQAVKLTYKELIHQLPMPKFIFCLFITTLVMQFAVMSIQPIITVYISQISSSSEHIALIAGAVFSCSGLASMLSGSRIGHLADRIGSQKVLLFSLILAGLSFIPQGLVNHPWQLGILRFMLGIAIAGLLPSVNNLIRQHTPPICLGGIYGLNQSAQFMGMFLGALFGGHLAAAIGIENVFFVTAALLLLNAVWCRFTVYNAITGKKTLDGKL
jgi:MFS family permease